MTLDSIVTIANHLNISRAEVAREYSRQLLHVVDYYKNFDQEWYRNKALELTKKHYKVKE